MERFPRHYHETDRDSDFYERRAEAREERNREDLVESQMNCEHRLIVNGKCRHCGQIMTAKIENQGGK